MYQDYKDLLSAFHAHGVKYLIVGGFAVIYHAQPRFTKDIDLFIKADPENAKATYAALAEFGAPLQGIRAEEFTDRNTFFRFGPDPKGFDILPAIPGVDFDAAWERRVQTVIDASTGQKANFISADDLIASKLASGRPQDLADADAIRKAAESQRPGAKKIPRTRPSLISEAPAVFQIRSINATTGPSREYDRFVAGLRSACALAMVVGACVLCAVAQSGPGFRIVPPISDADPLTRHQADVSMPALLSIHRTPDHLSVSYEPAFVQTVKVAVGKNMAIGVRDEFRVYVDGAERPLQPRSISKGSIPEKESAIPLSNPDLLNSAEVLSSTRDGIPAVGKRYVIEHDITLFETDIPPQHMWQPENSRQYRVLWNANLKTVE